MSTLPPVSRGLGKTAAAARPDAPASTGPKLRPSPTHQSGSDIAAAAATAVLAAAHAKLVQDISLNPLGAPFLHPVIQRFWLARLQAGEASLDQVPEAARYNEAIIRAAFAGGRQWSGALPNDLIRYNRPLVLEAIAREASVYYFGLAPEDMADREIFYAGIHSYCEPASGHMHKNARKLSNLSHLPYFETYLNDRSAILQWISKYPWLLASLTPEMQDDEEIVTKAVLSKPAVLVCASKRRQDHLPLLASVLAVEPAPAALGACREIEV